MDVLLLGVMNISICQYFLTNLPQAFWIWYSAIMPVLLFSRLKVFHKKGWHYFMLDFCYFTVLCTFLLLYLLPSSQILFKMIFLYANGPLCWAIVVWRNSFVFHDYDKITSVYIHILPSMLTYTLRWHAPSFTSLTSLSALDFFRAALGYILWQAAYFLKTECLDKEKLDRNPHLLTSLRWLSRDEKNYAAKKVLYFCRRIGFFEKQEKYDSSSLKTKFVLIITQFIYSMFTLLPCLLLFRSKTLHLAFIALIMTVSIYFGASYYIEVFSERYQLQFSHVNGVLKLAHNALQARTTSDKSEGRRSRSASIALAENNIKTEELADRIVQAVERDQPRIRN